MNYFANNYKNLRFPLSNKDEPGYRAAQMAAIQSIGAHFFASNEPALITMPTGSGKTTILITAAYILHAKRVLVITPSRLVRDQIVEGFQSLDDLKNINALESSCDSPAVYNVEKKIQTEQEWEAMRAYDVVVGITNSTSPAIKDIPAPPEDLFDLILIDEAHHSPAKTWKTLLERFPTAKKVLFTATPFRRDQKEIKAKLIFNYSLKKAYEDNIFGDIEFSPVIVDANDNPDLSIARSAEAQLKKDRKQGLKHLLMVRTDSKNRGKELEKLYKENTNLNLPLVTGGNSLKQVKKIVKQLREEKLDGIICVNMFGEGFNLPNLKVAAIHSPHHSLAVTLQFIGRFARTKDQTIGKATFFAIPQEIENEVKKLFESGAIWQELIQNLSSSRITQEIQTREVLDTFTSSCSISEELEDFSLFSLKPKQHVKIYNCPPDVDFSKTIAFPNNLETVFQKSSVDYKATVYITQELIKQTWTSDERFNNVSHDLFVIYYHEGAKLLFICSSRKEEGLYQHITSQLSPDSNLRILSLHRINKVLNGLSNIEFFNVGLRNRNAYSRNESYRIITGSSAAKVLKPSDSRLYNQGHFSCRALHGDISITLGASSGSKVWSMSAGNIAELIQWCDGLAKRISSEKSPITNTGLDLLSVGEEATEIPPDILCVDWGDKDFYIHPITVEYEVNGSSKIKSLLDFELKIESSLSSQIIFSLSNDDICTMFTFSFDNSRLITYTSENEPEITVIKGHNKIPILAYLNETLLNFYTANFSRFDGINIFKPPTSGVMNFDLNQIEVIDWVKENVDITTEVEPSKIPGKLSIQEYLKASLPLTDALIVFHDHGKGEMADFIVFQKAENKLRVQLLHCKKTATNTPGNRLDDFYEVIGQAVKSLSSLHPKILLSRIQYRNTNCRNSTFLKGDMDLLKELLGNTPNLYISFEAIIVQPGISKGALTKETGDLLASASDFLTNGDFEKLRVLGSA